MRKIGPAPSIEEMEKMGRAALDRLPQHFSDQLGTVVFGVEEYADPETLAAVGLSHPYELTGVYEGVALTEQSIEQSGTMPTRIRLFRRAILDEWAERGDETLEHLMAHVVIHEVGHHFGLSDEDMHALEDGRA